MRHWENWLDARFPPSHRLIPILKDSSFKNKDKLPTKSRRFLFSAKPDGTISELKVLNQIQNTSCAIDYNTSGLYYPSLDYNGFLFPLTLFHSSALWLYLVIQKFSN
ncbi:hypothetical protein RCL_jg3750.t1 [Rhizophagus clarus]|uniref:Uncharacterized protein n=1 Tax=Rhizophagus clarus TaxID=94130 RepID=A0A8H3QNN1_9GLOM|nr:hypothetical protein RCL_jg3750.t1 [Rhizophagus clarus]